MRITGAVLRSIAAALLLGEAALAASGHPENAAVTSRIEQARADLARRLEVPIGDISVELEEEVTWPDASLGCPRKGMVYRQQLVNGSRLLLRVGKSVYAYHAGGGAAYFYCVNPTAPLREEPLDR